MYCNKILGFKTCDSTNAFKMIKRDVLKLIELEAKDFDLSFELTMKLHKKGYKICEVPTVWLDRSKGESKFSMSRTALKYAGWFFK